MPASRRRALVVLGFLLGLVGCTPPEEESGRQHPANQAAFEACWQTVLQRENQELNRQDVRQFRARGGG